MDIALGGETFSWWLLHFGSVALFCFLMLGILALPIPEETLMVIAGAMMHEGRLIILWTIVAAYAGSMCGISMSYLLGRTASRFVLSKSSRWIGIKKKHLDKGHAWFEKYGTWTLFFGYFIPGVRHFTGIIAGVAKLEYKRFAIFAYSGAIVWATVFLAIGYLFGAYFFTALKNIEIDTDDILSLLLLAAICVLIFYTRKKK